MFTLTQTCLIQNLNFHRPLKICDLDFTDLGLDDNDGSNKSPEKPKMDSNGIPLPPPIPPPAPAPPPPPHLFGDIPNIPPAPPMMNGNLSTTESKWKIINR